VAGWHVLCLTADDGWRRDESSSLRASCIDDASNCSACRLSTSCSTRLSWSPDNDDDDDSGDMCRRAMLITSSDSDSTKSSFDTVSLCWLCGNMQTLACLLIDSCLITKGTGTVWKSGMANCSGPTAESRGGAPVEGLRDKVPVKPKHFYNCDVKKYDSNKFKHVIKLTTKRNNT